MIDGKYLNINDILSYGYDLNIIDGKREIGKSYGNLLRAHARRIRNHEGMVWVRMFAEDADLLASSFGNGKWQDIWRRFGISSDNVKRSGRRILWRKDDKSPWLPMIRYIGLSEWENYRDADDPQEKYLFFDEFIQAPARMKRYAAGIPSENLIDLWISLRRGKDKMPMLLAGNPELGEDWLLPSLYVNDRQTPERVRVYDASGDLVDRAASVNHDISRIAVLWTTNKGGQSSGGRQSGVVADVPHGARRALSGRERLYATFDFGDGIVSVWYTVGGFIVSTRDADGRVFRLVPDADPRTVVFTQRSRKNCGYLRDAIVAGKLWYTDVSAFRRFGVVAKKIL